jgi:hypothetical protein
MLSMNWVTLRIVSIVGSPESARSRSVSVETSFERDDYLTPFR